MPFIALSVFVALLVMTLAPATPAAALETVATFAANCTTPKTVFQLGDTVCAKVSSVAGGDLNNIWLKWVAPSGAVVAGSPSGGGNTVVTTDPQTFTFVLPTSGAGAEQGLWKAQTANVSDSAARVTANFRVPRMNVIGIRRDSNVTSYVRNSNTTGIADGQVAFGQAGDIALWGDWQGNGRYTAGVYRPTDGTFHIALSNSAPAEDIVFQITGVTGGKPLVGDWNGDGTTDVGVYVGNTIFLRNSLTSGPPDTTFDYGIPGDQIFAGDWDGDGIWTPGVYRDGIFFLRNSNTTGDGEVFFAYGLSSDTAVVGNWTATDGITKPGVFRPSEATFYLRNSLNTGNADIVATFGIVGDVPNPSVHNEAPVVTAGGTLAYTESQAATAIDPALTVTDMDNGTLVGATATITSNCASGEDVLSFVTQNGISGVYTAATCLMTLTGQSSLANYQTALRDVKYNNTSTSPSTAARTVTWRVNDGSAANNQSAAGVTSTINVTSSNSAPVLTAGGGFTYTEGDPATVIDITVNVTDADSANLQSATVQITAGCSAGQDVLSFVNIPPITGSGGGCNLTLTGSDTVANWIAALRTVKYNNTSNAPSTAARTVTWQVNDGTDNSNTATSTITVVSVNSVPQLTAGGTLNYTENQAATAIDNTITITDADSPNLTGATVQITAGCSAGEDVLSFVNIPPIIGSGGGCSLTLSGTTTVANYVAALKTVKYANTSENPSGAARTVTWQVNDGTDNSNTATSTINVTPVNDAPTGASNKTHNATGNVSITTPVGTLTAGVTDVENNLPLAAQQTGTVGTSAQGGNVTVNSDGSYFYNPPAGYEGADSFTFKVCDSLGACTSPDNTVNLTVSNMIWFINNGATACTLRANGCGRLSNPYSTLAAFNAENNGGAGGLNPAASDNIFIYESGTDYAGPLVLLNNQKVIGQDASQTLSTITGITPPADSASLPSSNGAPIVRITGGTVAVTCPVNPCGIVLGQGNTLRGLTLGNVTSTGTALSGTNFGTLTLATGSGGQTADLTIDTNGQAVNLNTGTIASVFAGITSTGGTNNILLTSVATSSTTNLGSGALSGATAEALFITGQNGSFTYSGSITNTGGTRAVRIESKTGGTVTLSGNINPSVVGTAKGILVQSNSTGTNTIDFTGSTKIINTGTGTGVDLVTNTGATINFTNGGLDIDTTSGVGFNATGAGTINVSGSLNTITTTTGTALNLNGTGGTIGFDSATTNGGGTGATPILLGNVTGPVTITGGSLQGAATTVKAIDIGGGSANFTYGGTISHTGTGALGGGIRVINRTSTSTVLISGTSKVLSTGANNAVEFTGNTATSTLTFSGGGLDIDTTTGVGFNATAAGVVNVSGSNNTITSTTGTAVNLNGVGGTVGLKSVTANVAAAAGAANGIAIQSTLAGFSFTVDGDGSNTALGGNATGGTISRMEGADGAVAGNGVYLSSTGNITLRRMTINGVNQNNGIRGISVTNFHLEYSTVTGTNGNNTGQDEGAVVFDNLLGAATITNCLIEGGFEDNLNVVNTTGTLDRLVITGSTFGFNSTANGNNNILMEVFNPGTLKWTLQSSTIKGARADWINAQSSGGSGIMDSVIGGVGLGNTFDNLGANAHPGAVANGNRILLNANGTHTFNVSSNTLKGSFGNALAITGLTGTASMTGRIQSNDIGVAGTNNSGSTGAGGISVQSGAGSDITVLVDGNDVRQYNNHGIIFTLGDEMTGTAIINATVSNNTANTPGTLLTDFNGFHVNNGTVLATDDFTSCFNIFNNNFTGGGKGATPPNNDDLRLRQRQNTTIQLPGYTGPARDNGDNDVAEVVTYLGTGGLKNNQFGSAAANSVSTGGGYVNSPGGAACTLPP